MPDVWDDIDKYDWFHPGDVLMIKDTQGLVVAYGVPGAPAEESEPKGSLAEAVAEQAPVDDEPLPQPKHTAWQPGGPDCLACKWADLRDKIRDAS